MRIKCFLFFIALYVTGVSGQTQCDMLQQDDGYKNTVSRVISLNGINVIAPFDVLAGNEITCVLVAFYIDENGKPFGYKSAGAYPDNRLLRYAIKTLQAAVFEVHPNDTTAVMYFELKAKALF